MNTTTATALDAAVDVDELVLRRVAIDEQIARHQEEKDLINSQLIDELGDGTHETKHAKVVIARRGTVDKKRLAADYPADSYPTLYEPIISTEAMKQQFAPAALEKYKTFSAPSVTIR